MHEIKTNYTSTEKTVKTGDYMSTPIYTQKIYPSQNEGIEENYFDENFTTLFFHLVENSDQGILLINHHYNIKYANNGFIKLFSINKNSLIDTNIKTIFNNEIFNKIFIAVSRLILKNSKKGKIYFSIEKKGEKVDIKLKIIQSKKRSKNRLFILIFDNVTTKKKIKKQLAIVQKEAQSADKLKTIFLSQMSHEIRTPVTKIISSSNLLKEEFNENANSDLSKIFNIINRAGKRIINTIEQLLNLSEIETDSYKCTYEKCNIKTQILDSIVDKYKPLAIQKGLFLKTIYKTDNLTITLDQYSVSKILTYLIDNAIKFSSKGTVLISVEELDKYHILIKISDTGIGISKEYLPNLFTSFSQEESGYTRKYEGNGVGLYLVKKYCKLNNIDVRVKSEKGTGTTFSLIFNGINKREF